MTTRDPASILHPATLTLLCASSLTVMAGAVLSPALPQVQAQFAGVEGVEVLSRLLLTAPALAVALSGAPAGWAVDRLGPVQTLVLSLLLYGVAGTTGLWLDTLPALLVGRLGLGVAVAGIMTATTTLLSTLAGVEGRSRLLGLQAAFMALGGLVFLVVGGALTDLSWRGPFAVYAIALGLAPLAFVVLGRRKMDVISSSPEAEAEAEDTGTRRQIWGLLVFAVLGMVVFYLVPVQAPFLLVQRFQAEGAVVGISMGLMNLSSGLTALNYARIRRRLSAGSVLALTFVAFGLGLAGLAVSPTVVWATVAQLVFGVGMGLFMPNVTSWMAQMVSAARRGRAMGRLSAAIFLGQFVSPLVVAPLLSEGLSLMEMFLVVAASAGVIAAFVAVVGGAILGRVPATRASS